MRRSWWAAGRSASRSSRPSGCAAPSPSWRPTSRPRGARSPSGWGRTWSSIRRGSARSTPGRPPPVRVRPSSSSASACPGSSTSSCATRRARRASSSSASAWRTIASVPCTASTRSCRCSSCSATRRRSSRSRSSRSPRGASLSRRWSRDGWGWAACRARSRRSRTPTCTRRSWSSRGGELTGGMLGLVCVAALVLAVVALSRTGAGGSLTERIAALEREVRQLRALLKTREGAPERAEKPEPAPGRGRGAPRAGAPPAPPPFPARPAAPPPPPAAPPRPAAPPPVAGPRVEIDWEQLFGVRAAAGLGGVALALAGLLFFKYSVEHGLVPPWLRVVLGTVVGVACIAGSEWRLRREYARTADALAGAGMVVLYAAFWAASIRSGLVPTPVAFVLMVAVTASGCILSWRHTSQVIASLGLIGGFLTPLLLSTGTDRPIGLFGYVLLLDTGLLYLARRRRWPVLALLSLAGTVFYQALWIWTRMGPDRLLLGLAILGAFAFLFAAAPRPARRRGGARVGGGALERAPRAHVPRLRRVEARAERCRQPCAGRHRREPRLLRAPDRRLGQHVDGRAVAVARRLGRARRAAHPARDLPAAGVPAPRGGVRDGRRARGGRERPRPAARLSAAVGVLRRPARRSARLPGGRPRAPRARGSPHGRVRGRRAGRAAAPRASARARRAAPAALALPWDDARARRAGRAQRDAPGLRPGSARGDARHRARAVGLDVGVARARRDHAASPAGGRRAPLHRLAVPRRRPLPYRSVRLVWGRARRPRLVPVPPAPLPAPLRRRHDRSPARRAGAGVARGRGAGARALGGERSHSRRRDRVVRRRRHGLRHRRHPAPAREGVDHDRLGAGGPGGDRALGPPRLPGAQVLRVGAALRRHRPSGREPGGARLLSAAGFPHRELAPLHLPGAAARAARDRGAAPSARARPRARLGARAPVPARPACGRARSGARRAGRDLRLDQPRDRRLVRHRADAARQLRAAAGARPDHLARLGGLRARAARHRQIGRASCR